MKEDRIKKLEDYIVENEKASIEELCNMLNVSKNTLRRYINQLEEEAKIKKIYGGIILNDKKTTEPFEIRMKKIKRQNILLPDWPQAWLKTTILFLSTPAQLRCTSCRIWRRSAT